MLVFTKGNFTLNLGIACISTEISEEDRQCAWELYCELTSWVALMGKGRRLRRAGIHRRALRPESGFPLRLLP